MSAVVKWSVVLAVLVTALSVTIALTGLHRNPIAGGIVSILVAILFNVVCVFMALKQTSAEAPYGRQLLNGLLIGVVGGLLICLSSWLLLSVVFPDYLDEMRAGFEQWIRASGLPQDQIEQQIRSFEGTTPGRQAVAGLMGTFFTSLVAGAIIGIFLRKK